MMDGMFKIAQQAKYRFFGIDEVQKLLMDDMHEIVRFFTKLESEYSRICVLSVVKA